MKRNVYLLILIALGCGEDSSNTKTPVTFQKSSAMENKNIMDYKTDPRLASYTKDFLTKLNNGGKPLESLSPEAAREVLAGAQSGVQVEVSGIEETDKNITQDGLTVPVKIIRPAGIKGQLPVFIFIHGGGWVLGDYPTHKRMVRDLVVHSGFVAVFVDYTRTPEARYPQAINEIFAVTTWVAENGETIGVDGKNLAVVGNSVGGNMTAVTALKAKAAGGPHIKLLVLFWPIVDADFETDSYKQFGKDRFLTTTTMKWMYDMYIPEPEKRNDIYASPLQATINQLSGLPPTLIQVAENDVLRDEGEAFGRKLNEAGVPVTLVRFLGTIHDFGLLNGLAETPTTRSLFLQAAAELKFHLGGSPNR
jgi:acetyl esterase/lipase